jgi:acyl-CoA reductase-like NAD-dependent aldehyde dehydrogenase
MEHAEQPFSARFHGSQPLELSMAQARASQIQWSRQSVEHRLYAIAKFRQSLAANPARLINAVAHLPVRTGIETIAAEILPLANAAKFLLRQSHSLLRPRINRPLFSGLRITVDRRPHGLVLIVGPSNYPLFLPGVQVLQALVAGNAVLLKPGKGGTPAAAAMISLLRKSGIDPTLIHLLPEQSEIVHEAIKLGVDKVILTGSVAAGTAIAKSMAQQPPRPAIMELSGCDAVFILSSADLYRAVALLKFGLEFNGSATCIAPRRVFIVRSMLEKFEHLLLSRFEDYPLAPIAESAAAQARPLVLGAMQQGARLVVGKITGDKLLGPLILLHTSADMPIMSADIMAPLLSVHVVSDVPDAIAAYQQCPFRLSAAIFGDSAPAGALARRLDAGCIVINDLIAPTAHPAVPFTARGGSGYGTTRGAEGLLEMTWPNVIVERVGNVLPHLRPSEQHDRQILLLMLRLLHGADLAVRVRAALGLMRILMGFAGPLAAGDDGSIQSREKNHDSL